MTVWGRLVMSDSTNPFLAMTALSKEQALLDEMYPEQKTELDTTLVSRSDGTKIEVYVPDCCSPEYFRKVVAAAFSAYLVGKKYPDMASVQAYFSGNGSLKKLAEVMSTPEYEQAMSLRGIHKTKIAAGISPEQSYALEILTDPSRSRQSFETKLKAAGITYTKYRSWLKNPIFNAVFSSVTENMIQEHQGDVNVALVNKAISGDMRAIEYYNQLSGRFNPDRGQLLNLQAIVSGLLEIITRNIRDPEILDAVVVDIDKLIAREGGENKAIASHETAPPVVAVTMPESNTDFQFGFEGRA